MTTRKKKEPTPSEEATLDISSSEDPTLENEKEDPSSRLESHGSLDATLVGENELTLESSLPEDAEHSGHQKHEQSADPEALASEQVHVDDSEVLAEFESYDSLDDDEDPPLLSVVSTENRTSDVEELHISGDESARTPPKERMLQEMRLEAKVEAILFASPKPLKTTEVLDLIADNEIKEKDVQATIDQLIAFYDARFGGFKLHYLKRMGYQFQTAHDAGFIMERMFASRPRPISRAALETLAIIAYRQPVTRAEVEFIRGVDAGSIFKTLLERDLIKCVGRKEIVGRPMVFGTTDEFLKVFNLSSIKDLPPLEAFQPSREVIHGAMEKLQEGETPVDVEEYIAESTAGEYVTDASGEDWDEDLPDQPSLTKQTIKRSIEGASSIPPTNMDSLVGSAEELFESDNGTDSHSEVAFPDGPSIPPRGRDMDS